MAPRLFIQFISSFATHSDYLTKKPKVTSMTLALTEIKLNDVKEIKSAYECRFSDVLLHVIGNGVRKHLLEHLLEKDLPENILMGSSIGIPAHPDNMSNNL